MDCIVDSLFSVFVTLGELVSQLSGVLAICYSVLFVSYYSV